MPEENQSPATGSSVFPENLKAPTVSEPLIQNPQELPITEISEESLHFPEPKKLLPEKKEGFFARLFSKKQNSSEEVLQPPLPVSKDAEAYSKVFPSSDASTLQSENDLLKSISDQTNAPFGSHLKSSKILLDSNDELTKGESLEILEKRERIKLEESAGRNAQNFLILSQSTILFVVVLALITYGIFSTLLDSSTDSVFTKIFPNNYGTQEKNLKIEKEKDEKQILSMKEEITKNDNLVEGINNNVLLGKIQKNKLNWVLAISRLNAVGKSAPSVGTVVRFDSYSSKTGTKELIIQGRIDDPWGRVNLEIGKLIDAFNGYGARNDATKYFSGAKLMTFSKIKNEEEGSTAASMTFNFSLQYYPEGRDVSPDLDKKSQ